MLLCVLLSLCAAAPMRSWLDSRKTRDVAEPKNTLQEQPKNTDIQPEHPKSTEIHPEHTTTRMAYSATKTEIQDTQIHTDPTVCGPECREHGGRCAAVPTRDSRSGGADSGATVVESSACCQNGLDVLGAPCTACGAILCVSCQCVVFACCFPVVAIFAGCCGTKDVRSLDGLPMVVVPGTNPNRKSTPAAPAIDTIPPSSVPRRGSQSYVNNGIRRGPMQSSVTEIDRTNPQSFVTHLHPASQPESLQALQKNQKELIGSTANQKRWPNGFWTLERKSSVSSISSHSSLKNPDKDFSAIEKPLESRLESVPSLDSTDKNKNDIFLKESIEHSDSDYSGSLRSLDSGYESVFTLDYEKPKLGSHGDQKLKNSSGFKRVSSIDSEDNTKDDLNLEVYSDTNGNSESPMEVKDDFTR